MHQTLYGVAHPLVVSKTWAQGLCPWSCPKTPPGGGPWGPAPGVTDPTRPQGCIVGSALPIETSALTSPAQWPSPQVAPWGTCPYAPKGEEHDAVVWMHVQWLDGVDENPVGLWDQVEHVVLSWLLKFTCDHKGHRCHTLMVYLIPFKKTFEKLNSLWNVKQSFLFIYFPCYLLYEKNLLGLERQVRSAF